MLACCDLHTHSSFSDGSFTPAELAQAAVAKGIKYWALTDHDTVEGLSQAADASAALGIIFIPGVEFSLQDYENRPFHLLGLGIQGGEELLALCQRQTQRRRLRFLEICRRLQEQGITVDGDKLLCTMQGAPGRVQIARELTAQKLVKSVDEAFTRYLGSRSGNAVAFEKISLEEALAAIHNDGGYAFAAHPLSLNFNWDKTEAFLKEIRDLGVDGVEAAHSGSTVTRHRYVEAIARRLGMPISGGSDFHGAGKPQAALGRLSNGKPIPLSYLPALLKEKYCHEAEKRV